MTTEQLQNEILLSMAEFLDDEQLNNLQNVLAEKLKDVSVECTELATHSDTNEHYIEMFVTCKKIEGLSNKTLVQYYNAIKRFADMGIDLSRANTNHVRAFLATLSKNGCTNSSVNTIRAYLSAFYKWMADEGYVECNIVDKVRRVKQEKRIKAMLSSEDIKVIKAQCKNERETALIDLLESTGMRCSEIVNFKLSDIDWEKNRIVIHGKGAKDRYGFMTVQFQKSLREYLNSRDYDSEYVFCSLIGSHGQITDRAMERIVQGIASRAGIDVVVHMFRHYFCTELCRKGMPIQEVQVLMGHASIETTAKVYNHITLETIGESFDKYCA